MPRLKAPVAAVQLDMPAARARAEALLATFSDDWHAWLCAPVSAGRRGAALKLVSIKAMRRDFIRFWAHALRGQTGPWAPPAGAGRGGNAIRDALLGGDLDKGVSAWASEMLQQGAMSADTLRRSLNSLVRCVWALGRLPAAVARVARSRTRSSAP
jgi:hypothetical protein